MISLILSLIFYNLFQPVAQTNPLIVSDLVEKRLALNDDVGGSFPKRIKNLSLGIRTTAKSFVVIDAKTQKTLLENNSNEQLPIASLTKLMTALVFLETNPDFNKVVIISKKDDRAPAKIKVVAGDMVTVKDLFYSGLVGSTNNAIVAIARSTGLSEKEFVLRMNKKSNDLGLENTKFSDPTGLDSGNKSTVTDIIKLLAEALKNKKIEEALKLNEYEFSLVNNGFKQKVKNTDDLLGSYLSISGGKTGFTNEAGYNLAIKVRGDQGQEIFIALLGSESSYDRFQEAKGLATWAFENYKW